MWWLDSLLALAPLLPFGFALVFGTSCCCDGGTTPPDVLPDPESCLTCSPVGDTPDIPITIRIVIPGGSHSRCRACDSDYLGTFDLTNSYSITGNPADCFAWDSVGINAKTCLIALPCTSPCSESSGQRRYVLTYNLAGSGNRRWVLTIFGSGGIAQYQLLEPEPPCGDIDYLLSPRTLSQTFLQGGTCPANFPATLDIEPV